MSNAKEVVVTVAGLKALEDELEELKTVRRKDVAEKIKVARGFGDLSENSEYDEAKNEQAFIESRIAQLEAMLKNARVIDNDELNLDTVSVGTHVKIENEDGEVEEYDITGGPPERQNQRREPRGRCSAGPEGRPDRDRVPAQRRHHRLQDPGDQPRCHLIGQETQKRRLFFRKKRCHGASFCAIIRQYARTVRAKLSYPRQPARFLEGIAWS